MHRAACSRCLESHSHEACSAAQALPGTGSTGWLGARTERDCRVSNASQGVLADLSLWSCGQCIASCQTSPAQLLLASCHTASAGLLTHAVFRLISGRVVCSTAPSAARLLATSSAAQWPTHIEDELYCRQRSVLVLGSRIPFLAPDAWVAPNAIVVGDVDLFNQARPAALEAAELSCLSMR